MAGTLTISLDAMGGDHGPDVVLAGADIALQRKPNLRFEIFGDEAVVKPVLDRYPALRDRSALHHCEVSISMDDKPSQALRRGRWKSGMWKSIEAVKSGDAAVCVSAGNTGALMAMSKFCLRTMAGIERPAMAALWPTLKGESIVLDVGANVGAEAGQLIDFAVMGAAMARALYDLERPTVGLLNIGVEEVKGQEEVREAGQILRESSPPSIAYHGFVEGDDLGRGTVDVVVTEGFAGNIALKTAEGTARQISEYLRQAMSRTFFARIGYLFARSAFDHLREKMDPRKVNGAVFLGLNGVVIKSHGGTDAEGFAAAVEMGHDMVANDIMKKIEVDLRYFGNNKAVEAGIVSRPEKKVIRTVITGWGSCLPAHTMKNSELESMVDTSDEWIVQRSGIRERHIAAEGETTADLGEKAAREALALAGCTPDDLDMIILATSTPNNTFPATAVEIQCRLGMHHGFAFDCQAVCSGFIFALTTADQYMRTGFARRALVIGAETFSRIIDWSDRTTCVLFGDGAGAVVVEAQEGDGDIEDRGILTAHLRSDGEHKEKLFVDGGPSTTGTVGHLRMQGKEVFRHAVGMITDVIEAAYDASGLTSDEIDWFVPHQANRRIIDASAKKLGIPPEKVVVTVDRHGNTSAASIPLALCEAASDGRIKRGDIVLLEGMGGGFTWGSVLLRW